MDSKNKLLSEEDLSSDKKYQTSSNNMSNINQNILNHNNKYNSMTIYKNSDIPKINIKKIADSNPKKKRMPKQNMKSQTAFIEKFSLPKRVYKTSPYTFKYFCNIANKKKSLYNSSAGVNSIKENNDMESNFVNLSKNANIYTSNAEYIKNKKMLLFDKTNYDESKYKPDRANNFDMTNIPQKSHKSSTLYKTTNFRGGKLYFEKKLDKVNRKKLEKNVKNKFYENMPLDNMIKFIEQNRENLFPKINKKSRAIINDDSQENNSESCSQYNSLYKQLMYKRDEIFDNLMNNKINEYSKILVQPNPHQRNISNFSFNNNSTINPQNNSIDTNLFNNSSFNKINSSSNKFNNSSRNINNFSNISNLLSKKNNDGIPIIFPVVCSTFAKCNSVSQSSRYQNIMDNFIKVKTFIENDKLLGKENEFDYIREFLINKKIDKKHMTDENLKNFSNFLKLNEIPIDVSKSLKENILMGLYYDGNKYKLYKLIVNNNKNNTPEKNFNKYYKNKLLLNNRVNYKLNKNEINYKSLVLDLPRQSKLYENEGNKSDYKLKDELQKEIKIIENEIQDKQNIIKQIEKNLNLTPLYYNYYNNLKTNKIKNEKKEPKSIELRLASRYEANKSNISKNEKKMITNGNIYDSNERLYYSWYRDKKKGDINNFVKKFKLTEFVMYNKTKEKLFNEKFGLK